jgi:hypothetical protein
VAILGVVIIQVGPLMNKNDSRQRCQSKSGDHWKENAPSVKGVVNRRSDLVSIPVMPQRAD